MRRDLHDARFQLASTSTIDSTPPPPLPAPSKANDPNTSAKLSSTKEDQGESYVSAGAGTDLIPGLYEGGLKTWEGGVDLVDVLSGVEDLGEWVRGRGVMEVCPRLSLRAYSYTSLIVTYQ